MNRKLGYGLALVVALAAPFVGYPVFLMKLLCFGLFACAFNLLIGYTGLLSFGHAAFFGGAGYVTGHALTVLGLPFEVSLVLGVLASAALGLVMGLLAIRRQGIYFAMITLALAQMVYFAALRAPFTHGEDGLQGVPRGKLLGVLDLGNDLVLYFVVLAICTAGFALIVISSPVNGLRPLRALVAGLFTVFSFISPLKLNSPTPFLPRSAAMMCVSVSNTSLTLLAFSSVAVAISLTTSPRERRFDAGLALYGFFFAVFAI